MRGFTLIEMLVVVAIITLLSGVVIVGGRSNEKNLLLERAAHKVAQDIRLVLERSIQSEPYTCAPPGPDDFAGYGVYFDKTVPNSYLFFADCNGNQSYEGDPPDESVLPPFQLPDGVSIQGVDPDPKFDLMFTPPNPDIEIKPVAAEAKIVLQLTGDTTKIKTITINERGAISID